jgi:hypothetical protein
MGTVGHVGLIDCFNYIKGVHKLFNLWDYWDTRHDFAGIKSHPN